MAASCAATSRAWPGSSAQTRRSRKRRRPDSALLEQPVHLRREPHRGDAGGDLRLAARRGAVETEHAPVGGTVGRAFRCRCRSRPPRVANRPATAQPPDPPCRGRSALRGPAQTAPGHQQRHRLQQVGLAAAVRSEQHADAGARPPGECRIVAEVGQCEADETHAPICDRGAQNVNRRQQLPDPSDARVPRFRTLAADVGWPGKVPPASPVC